MNNNPYKYPIINFPQKFALLIFLVAIGAFMATFANIFVSIGGIMLLGLMFAHAIELQHECLHGVAFKNKPLNRIVGFVLGVPMLISFRHYQRNHLYHHRHLGRSTDKEFFNYESNETLHVANFISDLFGMRRLKNALTHILNAIGFKKLTLEDCDKKSMREYLAISLILLTAIVLSIAFKSDFVLRLWLIPLFLVAEPAHFLIELPEHLFCNKSSTDFYQNTRTIRGSWFSFWLTNGNNLHVEHHKKASLPIEMIPAQFMKTPPSDYVNYETSYAEFYMKVLRNLITSKRSTQS